MSECGNLCRIVGTPRCKYRARNSLLDKVGIRTSSLFHDPSSSSWFTSEGSIICWPLETLDSWLLVKLRRDQELVSMCPSPFLGLLSEETKLKAGTTVVRRSRELDFGAFLLNFRNRSLDDRRSTGLFSRLSNLSRLSRDFSRLLDPMNQSSLNRRLQRLSNNPHLDVDGPNPMEMACGCFNTTPWTAFTAALPITVGSNRRFGGR